MSRRLLTIAASVALLSAACVRLNADHCGNQAGDATCSSRAAQTPFCDICVAENDGCVAQAPPIGCGLGDAGADVATATSPTTTRGVTSDTSSTRSGSGDDPSTSTGVDTTDTVDPPDPCGNGQLDPGEECDGDDLDAQSCATLDLGGGDLSCQDSCFFDTSACTNMPVCGNDVREPGEICDTSEVFDCEDADADRYIGGDVVCTGCTFDYGDCLACLGLQRDLQPGERHLLPGNLV